ncbi:AbrB/MazE/SpoVT family DNA-binding domain-containing protein [Nocardioides sp. InS609-2]|uniref:AbrB/MazE/SpoVT family DNA-binding domain-containing protein n=1 Tax=Nocardioides sp. InS609-2 TaxID=2760705 RepID=UPI0020BDF4D0|nr:AbrB/MazE/SpoVT family DNA-binding domain-containing protein [Nocardioides sp. InS609-2]
MRTTIDSAGRIVVPKPVRDAMGLLPGRAIDVVFTDGRIEIEIAPASVRISDAGGLPTLVPEADLPPLTEQDVRDTIEATRR